MAFTLANWCCISEGLNQGQETVTPFGGSPTVLNAPNVFFYGSPNDTVATIVAANYFLPMYVDLSVGDWIMGNGTDASFAVVVTAVSSTSVTVASVGLTTSIGTANILDDAVTFAKMQDSTAANVLIGNPTGTAVAEYTEIPIGNGLEFNAGTLDIPNTNLIYTTVAITAAQFNGMYAAPKLLIAAPGANKLILVEHMALIMTFVSADYAAGGVVAAQYDNTVHGGGVLATNSEAAADFFAAASTTFHFEGITGNTVGALPFSTTVNKGLYLSNATQAFTTGDSTFVAAIWYRIVPTA
jgi:hypothetical protein